jgi:hypothetical protein
LYNLCEKQKVYCVWNYVVWILGSIPVLTWGQWETNFSFTNPMIREIFKNFLLCLFQSLSPYS